MTRRSHRTIGLSLENATIGQSINILLFGVVTFAGWSWSVNAPLFLYLDGQITQTTNESDSFFLQIGKVMNSTKFLLNIQEATINGIA